MALRALYLEGLLHPEVGAVAAHPPVFPDAVEGVVGLYAGPPSLGVRRAADGAAVGMAGVRSPAFESAAFVSDEGLVLHERHRVAAVRTRKPVVLHRTPVDPDVFSHGGKYAGPRVSERMAKEGSNIIFSHFPLLTGAPGLSFMGEEAVRGAEEMARVAEELPSGSAKASLWMVDEDAAAVALVLDDAVEIAEHLRHWAEGKPEEWFSFHFLEKGSCYAGVLMPSFRRSAERWKIAFQLRYGYPPPAGGESHLFRPLHFVAKSKDAFDVAKPYLRSKIRVGLVDPEGMTEGEFQVEREKVVDRVQWLGSFNVLSENKKKGLAHGWLDNRIEDMLKEG